MRKCFVLSTRTTVSKRNVTFAFDSDNTIVIPMAVVDELQTVYANQFDERGKIARELLDYLGSFDFNKLKKGVTQENGSTLRVTVNYNDEEIRDDVEKTRLTQLEVRILQTCLGLKKEMNDQKVILVSKSVALRMKAKMLGIEAQDFKDELLPEVGEQYTGRAEIRVPRTALEKFFKQKQITIKSIQRMNSKQKFYPNMFVVMKCGTSSAIGRVDGDYIVPLVYENYHPYSITAKNVGQKFMIEALMTDWEKASLVIIKGPAGTAKTFISLAVGLEQVTEKNNYSQKILISRSPIETGEKIGYLPGDETEKIGPYLRGILDNLNQLVNNGSKKVSPEVKSYGNKKVPKRIYDEKPEFKENGQIFFERGDIKAEAIGFIRGRTITDTYIIIDEAQNLTATEMKTIITRAGVGTKLVIIGDPEQIDRPELTERNNGLSYASERMKGETFCCQITMKEEESVRSVMAKRAAMLL